MQLTPDDFYKVEPLLNKENDHLPLLKSVLQRDLQGCVYVDNPFEIKSALIINRLDWVYFIGCEECDAFKQEIIAVLKQKKNGNYIWFGASDTWKNLVTSFVSNNIQDFPRFRYRFCKEIFDKSDIDIPVKVFPVDEAALEIILSKYYSTGSFWDEKSNFLQKGFGYYIKSGGEIVSVIMSASVTGTEAEIDIHTDANHRKKGCAMALSRAFINNCLRKSLVPKWDCYFENIASISLAEKLGFIKVRQYPLVFIAL